MLIFLERGHGPDAIARLTAATEEFGCSLEALDGAREGVLRLSAAGGSPPDPAVLEALPGVEAVLPVHHELRHVLRQPGGASRPVRIGGHLVGDGGTTLIAGPCAVEDETQLLTTARAVADAGAQVLRGGAFKPRTSPYAFRGLGSEGLELLALARETTGLPVVTEALDHRSLDAVARVADAIQIGARNMQNFSLLAAAGAAGRPVLLKRGMAATIDDLLSAAEYVMDAGATEVVLCERGIRTFSDHSRFTLDLSVVPVLRRRTHLPVIVDPSHACGDSRSVAPLACAAVAVGADGVMVEVHPDPRRARSDGRQALTPSEFAALAPQLRALEQVLDRETPAAS